MINGHDLEAFEYYEKVEAHRAVAVSAVEKGMRLQSETMNASVVAFEMAMELALTPMRMAAALSSSRAGDFSGFPFGQGSGGDGAR